MKKRNSDGFPFDDLAEPKDIQSFAPQHQEPRPQIPNSQQGGYNYEPQDPYFSGAPTQGYPPRHPSSNGYSQPTHPQQGQPDARRRTDGYFNPPNDHGHGNGGYAQPAPMRVAAHQPPPRSQNRPSASRSLDRQIQILTLLAAALFIVVIVLAYFVFTGGKKSEANAAANSVPTTAVAGMGSDPSADVAAATISQTQATTVATTPTPAPDSLAAMPPSEEHPVVALTFDDGPNATLTPELLDILKAKGVHVTFFLLGNCVESVDPAILKRMVDEGHEIGNHSYDHKIFTKITDDQIRSQITKTNDAIFKAAGVTPTVLRPPTGDCNDNVLAITKEMGLAVVNWSWESCPSDWEPKNQTVEFLSNHVISNARNGHIVLLHDIHKVTVESVSAMIDGLVAKGFRFATVSELLGANPGGQQLGKIYYYANS